jgi:PAS domain-containing protein
MTNQDLSCSAFRIAPFGQVLLAPTEALEIIDVNDAFLRVIRRVRADLVGRPLFEAFPDDPQDGRASGVRALHASVQEAVRTRKTTFLGAQPYAVEMRSEGVSWFEPMYWNATNTPLFDAAGQLAAILHTAIDVTAQVVAQ